jgi:hypothetical protein
MAGETVGKRAVVVGALWKPVAERELEEELGVRKPGVLSRRKAFILPVTVMAADVGATTLY